MRRKKQAERLRKLLAEQASGGTQAQAVNPDQAATDVRCSRPLSHADAVAASPEDIAVAGEEDAGIGAEFLVRESQERASSCEH